MKSITKLFNYKKWDYKIIIIFGLLLIIATSLLHSWFSKRFQEGYASMVNDISLNVVLTDNTSTISDPNPNGKYNIYTRIQDDSEMATLTINYPKGIKGEANAIFPFDSSGTITTLIIEPTNTKKDASYNQDKHKADMFPVNSSIDITMDNTSPVYILSQEKGGDTKLTNTLAPSTDLPGNEITIVKNGPILDANSINIGTAYKGDSNPLSIDTKNPYVLNIVLKNIRDISLCRVNVQYKLAPPDKKPTTLDPSALIQKAKGSSNNSTAK
jgi:hypothetical protein